MKAPQKEREADLTRATERLVRRRAGVGLPDGTAPLWNAAFFGLDRVSCFQAATAEQQRAVLDHCASALLRESWCIEQSGVAYCARMALGATTTAEQRLYALIGGDEATHALWLHPWLQQRESQADPFSEFVTGLAGGGDPQPLAYLLQVVLEGYGIAHYAALADHCGDAVLAQTFARIAQDEALHHGAGLALFDATQLSRASMSYIIDSANVFVRMLRNGPQAVVSAVDRAIGLDDEAAVVKVFAELNTQESSNRKLAQLRRLMAQPGMTGVVDEIARGGLFHPCSNAECARIYLASR